MSATDVYIPVDARIEDGVRAEFEAIRLVRKGDDGLPEPDRDGLATRLAELLFERIVRSDQDRQNAYSPKGLTLTIFPNAINPDSDGWDDLDPEVQEVKAGVWKKLVSTVGSNLRTDRSGKVQKLVGGREDGHGGFFVLAKGKITIGVPGQATRVDVVYVTDHDPEIMEHVIRPARVAHAKAADKYAEQLALIGGRRPELAPVMKRELSSGLKAADRSAQVTLEQRLLTTGDQD